LVGAAEPNSPRFSVCIRAYRRPRGLRRAIESALAQEVDDLEIVVSDDSGDMEDVVAAIGGGRVRYSRNPRPRGSIANLRRVHALARGEYVLVLDDDDRLLPGFLRAAAAPMDRDPSIGVVFTGYLQEAGGHRKPYPFAVPAGAVRDPLRMVLAGCQPGRSATLIRRVALEEGERRWPLLDDHVGDVTTWIRTAEAGWGFWAISEPFAIAGMHRGQISARENHERLIRTLQRFRFEDPVTDAIRRARLADARRRFALTVARRGRLAAARREFAAANAIAPRDSGEGWMTLIAGSLNVARPALHRFGIRHPRIGAVLRASRRRRGAGAAP
jgi:glycosyltransferase involved in cell wall biosynthesis